MEAWENLLTFSIAKGMFWEGSRKPEKMKETYGKNMKCDTTLTEPYRGQLGELVQDIHIFEIEK